MRLPWKRKRAAATISRSVGLGPVKPGVRSPPDRAGARAIAAAARGGGPLGGAPRPSTRPPRRSSPGRAGSRPAASAASPLGDDEAALAGAEGHDLAAPRGLAGACEPVGLVGPRRVEPERGPAAGAARWRGVGRVRPPSRDGKAAQAKVAPPRRLLARAGLFRLSGTPRKGRADTGHGGPAAPAGEAGLSLRTGSGVRGNSPMFAMQATRGLASISAVTREPRQRAGTSGVALRTPGRRRRERRITPIVMPLEDRTLLSQLPGTWAAVAPLPNSPDGGYDTDTRDRSPRSD
jgi:hypothetical protein